MGLVRTVASRSLISRPGRTLFSILGIALGVATVVAVVVLDHNTILGLSQPFQRRGEPDLELALPAGREDLIDLEQIEGVSLAARYFQNDAVVRSTRAGADGAGDPAPARVRLVALDAAAAPQLAVYSLAAGRDLATGAEPEVLIGTGLAEELSLEPGDSVALSRPRRTGRKVCVDGVLVEREGPPDQPLETTCRVAGILTRERLGRRSRGMVVLVDFELGRRIFRGAHVQTMVWGRRDPTVDVERLESSLAHAYSYQLNRAAVLGQAADERAFRTGVRMAGLLALVLGLYVIFHTLSMSLRERTGEVGTLHALGATRTQIARVFFTEAVLLAGGGILLGLTGGIGLARLLLAFGITTLGTGKHVGLFVVPWGAVLALAGVGFLVALIGSVYPLVTLRGTSTVGALRGEGAAPRGRGHVGFHLLYALLLALILPALYFVIVPVVGELTAELVSTLLAAAGLLSLVVILSLIMPSILSAVCAATTRPFTLLWPLAGSLTARAIRCAPARIGVSASALALVCTGFVGLRGLTGSLRGEVEVWAAEAVRDKVWVRHMPGTDFATLAAHLQRYPDVLGVEKGNARIHAPFLIMGAAVEELGGYGPCAEDPRLLRALEEQHGMILSRRLAADLAYEVGDSIRLTRADGRLETFRVVAVSDAYGHYPFPDERMYGIVADHHLAEYYCVDVDTVNEVAVRLSAGADPGIVEAAILDFHRGPHEIGFRTGAEVLAHHRFDIGRDFVLFDVLIVLTAALAGLGVLNGQLLAALERTKELGVLEALGTSRRQLAGMVLLEAAVVGLVGGLLGVGLGLLSTPHVVDALRTLASLDLPWTGVGGWAWVALVGSVTVALLSALYPVWRTTRVDAVRAVRTG